MNSNAGATYPRDYSDDAIYDRIEEHLEVLKKREWQEKKVFQLYPQVSLGLTELQSRASKRSLRASRWLSMTALILSVLSMIVAGIVARSSSRSADEWRTDQLAILGSINGNISSSQQSIEVKASDDSATLQEWRDDLMSILGKIDQDLSGLQATQPTTGDVVQ